MKSSKIAIIALVSLAIGAVTALAGDWHRVTDLQTGGPAKEVSANYQHVRTVQIQGLDDGVVVQTLWVRNGGQKREIRVAHSFRKGEKMNFDIGGQDITGFRISDGGSRGSYRIHVLTDGRRDDGHHGHHDRDDRYYRHDRYDRYDRWDDDRRWDDDWDRRPPPPPRRYRDDDDYRRDGPPSWWPW